MAAHGRLEDGGGKVLDESEFGFVLGGGWLIIPEEKLPGAEEADHLGKLGCMRGPLVDVAGVVAEGVIGWAAEPPGKKIGEGLTIGWPGFIATDSFRRHEVRIRPLPTGHAVFVMNIDHDLILGALDDRLVPPVVHFWSPCWTNPNLRPAMPHFW